MFINKKTEGQKSRDTVPLIAFSVKAEFVQPTVTIDKLGSQPILYLYLLSLVIALGVGKSGGCLIHINPAGGF